MERRKLQVNEILQFKRCYFSYNPNPWNLEDSCETALCVFCKKKRKIGFGFFYLKKMDCYIKYTDMRTKLSKCKSEIEAVELFLKDKSKYGSWSEGWDKEVKKFLQKLKK